MNAPDSLRFGEFSLVLRRRELLYRGAPVTIGTRALDLLTALVERRGRLATKDELMAVVWAGTIVGENNLAAQISALRKILAADPALARCLQTVPGRGYRFVADVEVAAGMDAGAVPLEVSPDLPLEVPIAQGHTGGALSLVVMPFASLGRDADQAYFARGLSHTVATDLSRIAGLLVFSSETAATLDGRSLDARQASRELGARYVFMGTVQRDDRHVRINAQLADGHTGLQVWSELFDSDDAGLFALQDRITGRIANAIGREVFGAAAKDGHARQTDPKSFDLVMRGIAADNRPQSLDSLREQEALFARAVELDPTHGDAHARLARALLLQVTQVHVASPPDGDLLARGVIAAETAVALDPGNARAHCAMGLVHVLRGDFERSVLYNETAITLDRNFALAHNNLGNSLVHLGRGAQALPAAEAALRLDPRGPQTGAFWTTKGFAHLLLQDIDAALACFSRARTANPKLPRALVGSAIALALHGDVQAANRAREELLKLAPPYRLSRTIDARLQTSPMRYQQFYDDVLLRGARLAGVPV